jgi:hypothetical protein
MKKYILVLPLLLSLFVHAPNAQAQYTPTPNIGMEIPSNGSQNWNVPLNYNFNRLDQLLSGQIAIPALSITGNLTVDGTVTAGSFVGVGGGTFPTISGTPTTGQCAYWPTPSTIGGFDCSSLTPGGAQFSLQYKNGTVLGGASFTGLVKLNGTSSAPSAAVGGDIVDALTASNSSVPDSDGLAGVGVSGTAAANYVPIASNGTTAVWGQLTQDMILPGFTISTFSGGSNVEIGASVVNPAFTASYSSTPTSATITNTDGTDSPHNLTTPFTSATITGTFVKTTQTTTTFTLTAIKTSTKTASQTINWLPRVFGGVGAAGATSSVTASGTTAILSNSAVLASLGLSASQVGSTFGPFSPSGQKIYLLLIGGTHTFKDASTGFAFAFNTPTAVSFVNANGSTVSMFLYESSNTLTGTFSVQVVN